MYKENRKLLSAACKALITLLLEICWSFSWNYVIQSLTALLSFATWQNWKKKKLFLYFAGPKENESFVLDKKGEIIPKLSIRDKKYATMSAKWEIKEKKRKLNFEKRNGQKKRLTVTFLNRENREDLRCHI